MIRGRLGMLTEGLFLLSGRLKRVTRWQNSEKLRHKMNQLSHFYPIHRVILTQLFDLTIKNLSLIIQFSMESKQNAQEAFSSFAKQLDRFVASGEKERPQPLYPKPNLQQKIAQSDEEHFNKIRETYGKFLKPQDAETAQDQEELLLAYRLFTSVNELNKTGASRQTFIRASDIATPLTQKTRYGSGGDMIYLQCWFIHEGAKVPLVPEFTRGITSLTITFVPLEDHTFTPHEKEIRDFIESEFYS